MSAAKTAAAEFIRDGLFRLGPTFVKLGQARHPVALAHAPEPRLAWVRDGVVDVLHSSLDRAQRVGRRRVEAERGRRGLDCARRAQAGRAGQALHAELETLNYRNLDEEAAFAEKNTTTEVLAFEIFERMAARIRDGSLGAAATRLHSLRPAATFAVATAVRGAAMATARDE